MMIRMVGTVRELNLMKTKLSQIEEIKIVEDSGNQKSENDKRYSSDKRSRYIKIELLV